MIAAADVDRARAALAGGGVVAFGADTVYGLLCRAGDERALARLHAIKRRPAGKPDACICFAPAAAEPLLDACPEAVRVAARRLVPGPVTLVLPAADGGTVGLRVPALNDAAAPLAALDDLYVQSSANRSGEPAPRSADAIDPALRDAVDVVLDAGVLPGTASTVIDLTALAAGGSWRILRDGALARADVARLLDG